MATQILNIQLIQATCVGIKEAEGLWSRCRLERSVLQAHFKIKNETRTSSKSHVLITVINRSMLTIYQLPSNDLQKQLCTEPFLPGSHLPLVKAQSSARLEVDKPQSNTHPESCTSPVMMSDRQMSASHPWEVKNCS